MRPTSQPELDVEIIGGADEDPGERRSPRVHLLVLAVAMAAALVAGPAVAACLATADAGPSSAVLVTDHGASTEPTPVPSPENANQREGRVAATSSTGENANQREDRIPATSGSCQHAGGH